VDLSRARDCCICGGRPSTSAFPYSTRFDGIHFNYLKCGKCGSVIVDPVPDAQTFSKMYAKSAYHDRHYDGGERADYSESAQLLRQYLDEGAMVLDYGCGVGGFLKACKAQRFAPFGVEFDGDAARFAAENANCEVVRADAFANFHNAATFDAIHMGDVLEHLPDPVATVTHLLKSLKPGGVLFVEGPLEVNPSPVFWAARSYGVLKHVLKPDFLSNHPPTHLFRASATGQRAFFLRVSDRLTTSHWQVYETGWPYSRGGLIKRSIAALAVFLGGRKLAGATFGNRFKAILRKD
jgi:SAM-dependent methyltransferase